MVRNGDQKKVPLKRDFRPPITVLQELKRAARPNGKVLAIAWERENGYVARYDLPLPPRSEDSPEVFLLAERIVKFLLWGAGGWRLMLSGPRKLCQTIRQQYTRTGARAFDVKFMEGVYGRPMEVELRPLAEMPQGYERALLMDNRPNGYRLGFDLGASDFKISAVKRGKVVFSEEFPWDPRNQSDPEYHYSKLNEGLKKAAECLPRVDAIGGSTAGVVVDNRIQVASLFRAVSPERYADAQNMFLRLKKEWGVPVEVANDGDVTALAGLMSLGKKGILGVAMGSSEAAGFIDRRGCLTGRLSELAFAPVDLHPAAPADEWSGDIGVGAMYFSQQAVNHLAMKKGMRFPAKMPLPERLKKVQERMLDGDVTALNIFQKIGLYLGYTVPWYREFYGFDSMMILGRVTSGPGGVMILETARLILADQFPEMAEQVDVFMPDEKARRVGQSVAAASLPLIDRAGVSMERAKHSKDVLRHVVSGFQVWGDFTDAVPYGSGHINDTYKVSVQLAGTPVHYLLQRINHEIFKQPDRVMENIVRVTEHLRGKLAAGGGAGASRKALTVVPARDGLPYARDPAGNWWRLYLFIEGAQTYDVIETERQAYEAARAFARFQNQLADLPAPRLHETIPAFHNTLSRVKALEAAAAADVCGRKTGAAAELAFVEERREQCGRLLARNACGEIPERITHNDTKINNVMLDDATGEGICVIDLDTVMPGLALYDFGDMVRSATASAQEDERDLSKVGSRIGMFGALARGYLSEATFLLPAEVEELCFAGRLITLTIGIRFLTDFLAGDVYFKTHRPGQNLDRCRTQFQMVRSMESQAGAMEAIIREVGRQQKEAGRPGARTTR